MRKSGSDNKTRLAQHHACDFLKICVSSEIKEKMSKAWTLYLFLELT